MPHCDWCDTPESERHYLTDSQGGEYSVDICEDCFRETTCCIACHTHMHNEDYYIDERRDDGALCHTCYQERMDGSDKYCVRDYIPSSSDIVKILELADEWIIFGNKEILLKTHITVSSDLHLKTAAQDVGPIHNELHLFGLASPRESVDREYHWIVSNNIAKTFINILDKVFINENPEYRNVYVEFGAQNRLGVSREIRKNLYNLLINLTKELSLCAELQAIMPSELTNQQRIISPIYSKTPQAEEMTPADMLTNSEPLMSEVLRQYQEMTQLIPGPPIVVPRGTINCYPRLPTIWLTDDQEEGSSIRLSEDP